MILQQYVQFIVSRKVRLFHWIYCVCFSNWHWKRKERGDSKRTIYFDRPYSKLPQVLSWWCENLHVQIHVHLQSSTSSRLVRRCSRWRHKRTFWDQNEWGIHFNLRQFVLFSTIFIDREAREIIRLVASVRLSVWVRTLSCLNRLTFDLDIWHEDRP